MIIIPGGCLANNRKDKDIKLIQVAILRIIDGTTTGHLLRAFNLLGGAIVHVTTSKLVSGL
jgi:hypothetical protein